MGDHKLNEVETTPKSPTSNSEEPLLSSKSISPVSHSSPGEENDSVEEKEDALKLEEEESGMPIDGGWGWVVVAACFGMHVLVVGGVKSFGVLFVEFQDKYHVSAKELGILQGMAMTIMMGLGLGANLLAVKFNCRKVVFTGGILASAGFILSSLIPSFEWVYLTYGIITGLGFSLSYSPCVVMVGYHFKKRRSLANGISVSGSGVGSFALPNLMRWILNKYNLNGCLLLMGGIMLNVCVCALLIRPVSSYKARKGKRRNNETDNRSEDMEEMNQLMNQNKNIKILNSDGKELDLEIVETSRKNSKTSDIGSAFFSHQKSCNEEALDIELQRLSPGRERRGSRLASTGDLMTASLQSISKAEMENINLNVSSRLKCLCCKQKSWSPKSTKEKRPKLFNWSLLSNPVFLIYAFACGLTNFAYPNIFFMLPAYAESNGQDRNSSALLVSIIGITDLLGRLFFGWFSDQKFIQRRYGFVGCIAISAALNLAAPAMTSFTVMAVYAALYGFFAGSYMALIAVMLAEGLGVDKLSSSFGLTTLAMAVSLLPGPFICGGIRDATLKWDYAFIFCGVMAMLGSIIPLFVPCGQRYLEAKEGKRSKVTQEVSK